MTVVQYGYPGVRANYYGLSTDTKPTAGVLEGMTFFETDTLTMSIYLGGVWLFMTSPWGGIFTEKVVTFTGAAGAGAVGTVNIFAITGHVEILRIFGYSLVALEGATATISLGLPSGSSALFIAATTATAIVANNLWVSTSPQTRGLAFPAATKDTIAVNGNDVIATIATANVTAGQIRFRALWRPMSVDGLLAAA